ncbi:hypothetical protein Tco_1315462 [Tanacetum coccineum]
MENLPFGRYWMYDWGVVMYYPGHPFGEYDHYYFSTCDDARCSFHDRYVEVVVTSRPHAYLRESDSSVGNSGLEDISPITSFRLH